MNRKILLIEPNYKNKYPPMGLMKLATYYKALGDDVTFFKGDLLDLVLDNIYLDVLEKLYNNDASVFWQEYKPDIIKFIKKGNKESFENIPKVNEDELISEALKYYRKYYYNKEYFNHPRYDRVGITTLFTFYWDITIKTINFAKQLCKNPDDVMVGGIMSSILPQYIENETGIKPFIGILGKPGTLDDNEYIVDEMTLDYSILEEINYKYPASNAYLGYMTRGCVNKCSFCAVPKLEPEYRCYIGITNQLKQAKVRFGEKKDLLLLDNNVFASKDFDKIIEEIKVNGFEKGSKFIEPNPYEIAIANLKTGYNDKAYIKQIILLLKELVEKTKNKEEAQHIYNVLEEKKLLFDYTASKVAILSCCDEFRVYFKKIYHSKGKKRIVDFNQGIDARLVTEDKMKKLSEIAIEPLRIAFDDWNLKDIYEKAIHTAVGQGITHLSNYLLYNFKDTPLDLYNRLKLNVDLCEKLHANIYSFPMKYHPIEDPEYFRNRDFIGENWNRKFIRTIQAILNSTKGKVGKGQAFFYEAFGEDSEVFYKLLYMPETFIVYRMHCKDTGITEKWWNDFNTLDDEKRENAKRIIENNNFSNIESLTDDEEILKVLAYYTLTRDDVEKAIKVMRANEEP